VSAHLRATWAAACAGALLLAPHLHAESWPDWAERASKTAPPAAGKAGAVELLRETTIRFDGSGRYTSTDRRVILIRRREGREDAEPYVYYSTDGGKVKSLRAWVRSGSGKLTRVDDDRAIDQSGETFQLYTEVRFRQLALPEGADAGSIVAWEGIVESRDAVPQFMLHLQSRIPVARSLVLLESPPDWTARATIWNHAAVEPKREGRAMLWEFTDLPGIEEEPLGIPPEARAAQIGISLVASEASASAASLTTWQDVSRWMAGLADPQAGVTPEVESKARSLTVGIATPGEKIRAIARYVQAVNYISVEMGLAGGGGYRPHAASEVLAKHYGDCKDKANLMRALLRAVGVESNLVLISATSPDDVREEWPSPFQFNHCVLGVRLRDGPESCLAQVPGTEPIAVFDPTDPSTPWGSLPEPEQGALALLVAPSGGALFRTSEDGPEKNHVERAVQAEVANDGTLTGLVRERSSGTSGSDSRTGLRDMAAADFRKSVADDISGGQGGVTVTSLETHEDSSGTFGIEAAFEAPRFARTIGGFLSLRPVVAAPLRIGATWPENRTSPLRLGLYSMHETGRVRLPEGSAVDEVPAPVVLETPFASYRLECRSEKGALTFERSFAIRARNIPVADYAAARRFFEQIRAAEATQVLLTRG
jgi:transglutaminase superfamily protein/uncharacterized protein DUF3857